MDALVRYITSKLCEGFRLEACAPVEKFLSDESVRAQLVDFCKPSGIHTLTFYYQPPDGDAAGQLNQTPLMMGLVLNWNTGGCAVSDSAQ